MRGYSRQAARRGCRGFTLMEMLIAMTLVGIALTIAFAALRFASRSWERTEALGSELDQLRVATSVVRRQLYQIVVIKPDKAKRELLFSGTADALQYIAPAPEQGGRLAALYHYRLRFVKEKQGQALWLDYRPWLHGEVQEWQGEVASSLLVNGLQEGRFSFLAQAENSWQAVWDKPEHLPAMIRMELRLADQSAPWPALVVAVPVSGSRR